MHFEGKVERKGLKPPQNPDRDGGRPPPQDDVYQQREYISCTRGFRWGVTRRVADICCLFLGQGVTSIFRKFPQARSAVGVRRKKGISLRRRRNDFRSSRSVNHFGCDERQILFFRRPPRRDQVARRGAKNHFPEVARGSRGDVHGSPERIEMM